MPLIDVTYRPTITPDQLRRLADALPHAVSVAVECPEEPYDGDLQPGDVELRFRQSGEYDVGGLSVVIEVRTSYYDSRAANRAERAEQLLALVRKATGLTGVGVFLTLPVAAWSQDAPPPPASPK